MSLSTNKTNTNNDNSSLKNNDIVSIIVPIYNASAYLSKCIESLINQTHKELEIILINDGSKDKSLEICNFYAKKDKRIKVFDKENGGVSSARNLGLDKHTGKYVTFVDSDDWVEEVYISHLYNLMISFDADYVSCAWKLERRTDKTYAKQKDFAIVLNNVENLKELFLNRYNNGLVACKLFKSEIISTNRFNRQFNYGEDLNFCYYYCKKIEKAVFSNTNYYHYEYTPNSLSMQALNPKKLSLLDSVFNMLSDAQNYKPEVYSYIAAWYFLINIEMLYNIKKYKYKNKVVKSFVVKNLKIYRKFFIMHKKEYITFHKYGNIAYSLMKLFGWTCSKKQKDVELTTVSDIT